MPIRHFSYSTQYDRNGQSSNPQGFQSGFESNNFFYLCLESLFLNGFGFMIRVLKNLSCNLIWNFFVLLFFDFPWKNFFSSRNHDFHESFLCRRICELRKFYFQILFPLKNWNYFFLKYLNTEENIKPARISVFNARK